MSPPEFLGVAVDVELLHGGMNHARRVVVNLQRGLPRYDYYAKKMVQKDGQAPSKAKKRGRVEQAETYLVSVPRAHDPSWLILHQFSFLFPIHPQPKT